MGCAQINWYFFVIPTSCIPLIVSDTTPAEGILIFVIAHTPGGKPERGGGGGFQHYPEGKSTRGGKQEKKHTHTTHVEHGQDPRAAVQK